MTRCCILGSSPNTNHSVTRCEGAKKFEREYKETQEDGAQPANTTRESDVLQMNVILTPGIKRKITISTTC
jgi:hypothetical protein